MSRWANNQRRNGKPVVFSRQQTSSAPNLKRHVHQAVAAPEIVVDGEAVVYKLLGGAMRGDELLSHAAADLRGEG
jgi:hypothetical protein